jgi:hypothetical protein
MTVSGFGLVWHGAEYAPRAAGETNAGTPNVVVGRVIRVDSAAGTGRKGIPRRHDQLQQIGERPCFEQRLGWRDGWKV